MKGYVEQLNGAIEGLNIKYDEETGKLKTGIKQINRKINAYKREARAAVYKEQIKKATEDLIKQEEKEQKLQEKKEKLMKKGSQSTGDAEADALANSQRLNQVADIDKQIEDVKAAKKKLETEIGDYSIKVSFDEKAFSTLVTKAKSSGFKVSKEYQNSIRAGKATMPQTVYGLVKAADPAFSAAVSKAKSAGVKIPKSIKTGINSGKLSPKEAISQINTLIDSESAKASSKSKSNGEKVPKKMAPAITSFAGLVKKAAERLAENADRGASGAGGKGQSRGNEFGSGFFSGIGAWISSVFDKAFELGDAADKGAKAGQDSGSPSKKAIKRGTEFDKGYIIGIASGIKRVRKTAVYIVNHAFSAMKIATGKKFKPWGQNFNKLASSVISDISRSVNRRVSKVTTSVSRLISKSIKRHKNALGKGHKKLKAKYDKVGEVLKAKYSKYVEREGSKLISTAEKTLNKLANKYQKAYAKIVEAKNTFTGNLKDYGSLYSSDSYGFVSFKNWGKATKDIKTVTQNLKKLKKWGISRGLLDQITSMSTEDQLKFTTEMIGKGKAFFKTYNKGYKKFIKQANKAGTAIYGPYVKALDKKYNKELKKTLNGLRSDLTAVGKQAGKGLISGLSSKDTRKKLNAVSKSLAKSIIRQIRRTLKIHSPSKVMAGLAEMAGQGLVNGLDSMQRAVQQSAGSLLQIPELAYQGVGLDAVTGSQELSLQSGMTIEVPLYINGKEFARATAGDMQNAINKRETRSTRNRGIK